MKKNVAVILAGGSGTRMRTDVPKQFLKVAGRQIIEHTIQVFQDNMETDEIAIVIPSIYRNKIEEIVNTNGFSKVKKILNGGKERYESTLSAIYGYENTPPQKILIHDAVRPLLDDQIIKNCYTALNNYDAIDVAIPATDTIINTRNGIIDSIPQRKAMMQGQTPQGFKFGTLRDAYKRALASQDIEVTDDCGIIKKYMPEIDIFVVEGARHNIKVTYSDDLYLVDRLFQLKNITGNSLTSSEKELLKNKKIAILGGSYGIGEHIAQIGKKHGAEIHSFSRTQNGVDISKPETVNAALANAAGKEGLDAVIVTAGLLKRGPLVQMNYDDIQSLINVDYTGSLIAARESFQHLSKKQGSLLLFTSSSYTRGRASYSVYSSLKAAIVNLTQALADEWNSHGVRVNCINPERTATPMRRSNFGIEPEDSLLSPEKAALISLKTAISKISGQVIDARK